MGRGTGQWVSTVDEIRPQFQDDGVSLLDQTAIFNSQLTRTSGVPIGATISALDNIAINAVSSFKALAQPWYSDQILPFDVTLAGTNEYGAGYTPGPARMPVGHRLARPGRQTRKAGLASSRTRKECWVEGKAGSPRTTPAGLNFVGNQAPN